MHPLPDIPNSLRAGFRDEFPGAFTLIAIARGLLGLPSIKPRFPDFAVDTGHDP